MREQSIAPSRTDYRAVSAIHCIHRNSVSPSPAECPECGMLAWCRSAGLDSKELEMVAEHTRHRLPVKRNGYLYRTGAALESLHAVRTGIFKTTILDDDGREQVTGFHMPGDLMGIDAIGSGKHMCNAIALEDSVVCGVPFGGFERLIGEIPRFQKHFHRLMSSEITRSQGIMLLLGSMHAEERLAVFLLDLSRRHGARDARATRFSLQMTREDIGSHLGLTFETVSRALSSLQRERMITVRNKDIEIKDLKRLKEFGSNYGVERALRKDVQFQTA